MVLSLMNTLVSLIRSHHFLRPAILKVLTTSQPDYLHNLIFVQSTCRTHSSSAVTLARPSVSSSLQITNRSFTYAAPYLWNQLPSSFRQPHSAHSPSGFTSSCTYHLITVTTFTLTIYHSLGLSLQI